MTSDQKPSNVLQPDQKSFMAIVWKQMNMFCSKVAYDFLSRFL